METRLHIDLNFLSKLTSDQRDDLECEVTKDEMKKAVWDCGIEKSPGLDGFMFSFYRRYWKIMESDVVDAVSCFFQQGYFPKGGYSSYISLILNILDANMVRDFRPISLIGSLYKIIAKFLANRIVVVLGNLVNEVQSAFVVDREILDAPFILNKILQWCKSKKKQSLVFKVNFEKAYDSVQWDFLVSFMVNGSPTEKFQFYKGLKQGDPLSPFCLFWLWKVYTCHSKEWWTQWNESNIDTIVHVLECFHRASGLRINMSKSKLLGIFVDADKVDQTAMKIGCVTLKTSFTYLGSKVGGLMSRIQSSKETIEGMVTRLSKWKMKTLSIGGRSTLIKSPRGGVERVQFDAMVEKVEGTLHADMRDRWTWLLLRRVGLRRCLSRLGLGELAPTKLIVELADRTVKHSKRIADVETVEGGGGG
ncbi:RNA-directed DNA polymerase, eukaryota, reverse transcriptase zinc-binding domain protein [Tanacetum coccineum]|uniref:RNA-directed DNA polymerase, eukaryota, reverse transcriptase zinc-binding domain protein n=1 Tax=Tanacetum coccineum TaxID=301880 RepID=A0ABQ5C1X7_9ASTR